MSCTARMLRGKKISLTPEQEQAIRLARQRGWPIRRIAGFFRLSYGWVQSFLQTRPIEDPELVFPPGGQLTPKSPPTPIRNGDIAIDMVSHQSGFEDSPALWRDPRTDPRPDPKPPPGSSAKARPLTRRQRRAELKGRQR